MSRSALTPAYPISIRTSNTVKDLAPEQERKRQQHMQIYDVKLDAFAVGHSLLQSDDSYHFRTHSIHKQDGVASGMYTTSKNRDIK